MHPAVAGAYDRGMRSEEIAIRAGDLKEPTLSDVQRQARDYVVSNGICTGYEYGAAISGGKIIDRFTSSNPNRLKIPDYQGADSGSIEIHHNHPIGDSFSSGDFASLLSIQPIGSIVVHGHSGFFASAVRIGNSMQKNEAIAIGESVRSRAMSLVKKALLRGDVSYEDASSGLWQVVAAMLLESDGLIAYTANSEKLMELTKKVIGNV